MKKTVIVTGLLSILLINQLHAIEMWHAETVWAGQGMCSASFSFDGGGAMGGDPIQKLRVSVAAYKAGKKVDSGILEVEQFNTCNADRYAGALLESEAMCNDNLTIVVTKATAIVNGKKTDLLKTGDLSIREFKPFQIKIQK